MKNLSKKILISAGEHSGDMHAATLISDLLKKDFSIKIHAMGGELMQKAGAELIIDAKDLNIIGALEIITKFKKIWNAFKTMKRFLFLEKPDLLILVDYPGFNLRLAKTAKKAGVKVLYYISPKVWAWNQGRIKKIKKYVDMMAVIFPFEVEFYKKYEISAKFVGNPLVEKVKNRLPIVDAQQKFNLDPNLITVGIFPGSRSSEIKRLLPIMLKSAEILKLQHPDAQFLLSQASSINIKELKPYLAKSSAQPIIATGNSYDAMQVCDEIISASGTATLEMTLLEIPFVLIYKMVWWEYQIAKRLVKIPFVGLCNILAGKQIVSELLQDDANPEKIAAEISKILSNKEYRETVLNNIKNIKNSLQCTEKEDISDIATSMLSNIIEPKPSQDPSS